MANLVDEQIDRVGYSHCYQEHGTEENIPVCSLTGPQVFRNRDNRRGYWPPARHIGVRIAGCGPRPASCGPSGIPSSALVNLPSKELWSASISPNFAIN